MGCAKSKVANDVAATRHNKPLVAGVSSKFSGKECSLHLDLSDGDAAVLSIKSLTFRHVMKDQLGREYFLMFLKMEHAEENLIFFEEVEVFKAKVRDAGEDIKHLVEEMVATYLMPGVETEVNISDQMKRALIKAATNDIEHTLQDFLKHLDRAQNEIMMILAMGAFPRFLKSKFFLQYKLKAREMREKEDEEDTRCAESTT